jgi:hypothetical protein
MYTTQAELEWATLRGSAVGICGAPPGLPEFSVVTRNCVQLDFPKPEPRIRLSDKIKGADC